MNDYGPSRQMTWDELLADRNSVAAERDRLKAELEHLSCPICGSDVDGNNWKSKAEKAIELAQEMIAYHFYEDNKPDYFNEKYEWSKRLAEFEKESK